MEVAGIAFNQYLHFR